MVIVDNYQFKLVYTADFAFAEFTQCIKGRTVTMAWKCRAQNSAMKECLAK